MDYDTDVPLEDGHEDEHKRPRRPGEVPLAPSTQTEDVTYHVVPAPANDKGITVGARIDGAMVRNIDRLLQRGLTPFDTKSDLVRAAVHFFYIEVIVPALGDPAQTESFRAYRAAIDQARVTQEQTDVEAYINLQRNAIMKAAARPGFEDYVVSQWRACLHGAKQRSNTFRKVVHQWMDTDPGLAKAREIVQEYERRQEAGKAGE